MSKTSFSADRRQALRRLGAGGLAASLGQLASLDALAQTAGDYKALVCIFLYGGNDGHNVLIPASAAGYAAYKAARGMLALPDGHGTLLPVTAATGAVPYALHSALGPIHPLWAQGRLAAVANVGTLMAPTTRAQVLAGTAALPTQLFSHPDQQNQMQAGNATAAGGTGWGGRATDELQKAGFNGVSSFPSAVSVAGQVLYTTGDVVPAASVVPGLDMRGSGMSSWVATATAARQKALAEVLAIDGGYTMVGAANQVRRNAVALGDLLAHAGSASLTTVFPGSPLGVQLKQVAQLIKLRAATGLRRQVFFCGLGGFDTHSGQAYQQFDLLTQVGQAMGAFYAATVELGLQNAVTTFTLSEFGRSLQPSGSGSDHGWGNHLLVMGGSVKGGDVYGSFPDLTLGGANDSGSRGAMIPTTSIEQFGATLARWYGVTDHAALDRVFTRLPLFPTRDLGFMA